MHAARHTQRTHPENHEEREILCLRKTLVSYRERLSGHRPDRSGEKSDHRISGSFSAITATKKVVPLLNWLEVVRWPKIIKKSNFKTERDWVTSESGIAGSAFALKITTTDYAPEFRKGSTIIVDCSRSLKEGDFVLGIQTKNNIVLLGEFIVEKNKKLLRLFSQLEKEFQIDKAVTLCGVIAEAKHSF